MQRRRSSSLSLLFDGEWQKRKYGQKPSSKNEGGRSGALGRFDALRDEATVNALLDRVLLGTTTSFSSDEKIRRRLSRLQLIGRGPLSLPTRGGKDGERVDVGCVFLTDIPHTTVSGDGNVKCLPLPLSDNASSANRQLKLLSFAHYGKPISKSLFLTISPLLTGRDGSLWDNLPWTTWTIDQTRERLVDAAQNPVAPKFHPGKRDAFERMNGKDWYGRSLSGGNLKARLEYWLDGLDDISLYLENANDDDEDQHDETGNNNVGEANDFTLETTPKFDDEAASILARRILEVEKAEATMAVAEAEQNLALIRQDQGNGADDVASSLNEIEARTSDLEEIETALADIQIIEQQLQSGENDDAAYGARTVLRDFLAALTKKADDDETKASDAPYRGAYGYSAVVDTPEEMFWKSVLPYRSPYDLLLEIISEQLNADVIGAALENTSIFDGEVILGGAVVLRRRGRPKSITVGEETIEILDEDDDFGSLGVKEGELFVVECDADEAIGLALAADLDVLIEDDILQTSRVDAIFSGDVSVEDAEEDVATVDSIPLMSSSGYNSEGGPEEDAVSTRSSSSSQSIPQPPKTTNAFLDFFAPKTSGYVYNTNNPIQSLGQYDSLSIQDKGRLLLSLPSFDGELPRPRVLREYENQNGNRNNIRKKSKESETMAAFNPIDDLLIPFIDESVRREFLIRDAEIRGDVDEASRLREEKSKRLVARERAAMAREVGQDEEADRWEEEADLQANLRADVTQDEGEYSRFLDRDDWYERERVARAKRLDKKKFGTLLDGIE